MTVSYYQKNREHILARMKKYYWANRDVILSRPRDPLANRKASKRWYERNRKVVAHKKNAPEMRESLRKKARSREAANPERAYQIRRKAQLKALYGLTPEQYDVLRVKQNYSCAVCGRKEQECSHGKLHVDHCHGTKIIRGLLCSQCNTILGHTILGLASERADVLHKLIQYVDRRF